MLTDLQIAQQTTLEPISHIISRLQLLDSEWLPYGNYMAKLDFEKIKKRLGANKSGQLILVTAISPTPSGEGKTTVTLGLTQALQERHKNVIACLREPSLGPVLGRKGGATGGGYAQMLPMEDINLHFTGDLHAVTSANNFLAAALDNHIYHGNALQINPQQVLWRRCLDVNDRALRKCTIEVDRVGNTRVEQFQITAASEIMAIVSLSTSYQDLKARLQRIIIAYNYAGEAITPNHLGVVDALCILLQQALKPNLVQTLNHAPVLVHGGPFANIAHGCSSVIATDLALQLADFVVTEAGFGADLGAEKFLDIKCRQNNLRPQVVVLVVTLKALYHQSGVHEHGLHLDHLRKHIRLLKQYGLEVIVAGNIFATDKDADWQIVNNFLTNENIPFSPVSAYANGSVGALDLANNVLELLDEFQNPKKVTTMNFPYNLSDNWELKITKLAQKIYGAKAVHLPNLVKKKLRHYTELGYQDLPVCVAKTPFSFTGDATILGAPKDFTLQITDVGLSAGAGFVLFYVGNISTMPGLPKNPTATKMKIDFDKQHLESFY